MDKVETEFLSKETLQLWVWLRYIDDIFFVWNHGEAELKSFLERLNGFHPNLKFTHESSRVKVNFLDVVISNDNGDFASDLYCKPTDCHQFLDFGSCHPAHVKKSIIYSQALRIKRLCSSQRDFENHLLEMKSWFCNRNYPEDIVDSELNKASFRSRQGLLERKNRRASGVPFVVTFHPGLNSLSYILKKHLHLLYGDSRVKVIFTPAPFVSYRSGYSVKNHLVRAKVYPLERVTGSLKCGKSRCKVCENVEETNVFQSTVTKEEYKVNHKFCCDDSLVYLLTCKICKLQYVGQTVGGFRYRWNNYTSVQRKVERGEEVRGQKASQKHFHQHFLSSGHNGLVQDCGITFIDKTDYSDPTRREDFWIHKLDTLHPNGLNMVG